MVHRWYNGGSSADTPLRNAEPPSPQFPVAKFVLQAQTTELALTTACACVVTCAIIFHSTEGEGR